MEPVSHCSELYSALKKQGKAEDNRLSHVDSALLSTFCKELQHLDEISETRPQFKTVKTRFIWLAKGDVKNSSIDLMPGKLNTILYAIYNHRIDGRIDPSLPECEQMEAVREIVTKYLVPKRGKEGFFSHTLLDSCKEDDEEKFNDAVGKIAHRFLPRSKVPKTVDTKQVNFNQALQELKDFNEEVVPNLDISLAEEVIRKLQALVGRVTEATQPEAVPEPNTNIRRSLIRTFDEAFLSDNTSELRTTKKPRIDEREEDKEEKIVEGETGDMTNATNELLPPEIDMLLADYSEEAILAVLGATNEFVL